jgi:CubicO group peptidase (beta-lactamase class C family)
VDRQDSTFSGVPNRHFRAAFWSIALAFLIETCNAQKPVERMDKLVQSYADAQMFMGSVLVAQHGKVLFSKSYGWADAEWNIPNSPTTKFNIASVTKQFTAASILLLEERGKLKTDDPVKKYLPDAPAAWDKITIYNLLTMTSGIPDDGITYEPGSPGGLVFRERPLDFQPGGKWDYKNHNYFVLGRLVERVSGQSYADFLQENIFKPLGMNDSGLSSVVAIIPHRASGYWPAAEGMENAERLNFSGAALAVAPSGGIYSTTEDMLRWENGLFGGKLLTAASLRKMTTPFKHDYACGLYARHVDGRLLIDYDGNNIGYTAQMAYYPEDELAVVVLANLNSYATGKINTALAALAHGEAVGFTPPPREIPLHKDVLAQYVGTYEFSDSELVLTLEGSHLVAQFGATFPLFAASETKFFSKGWDLQFEFSKNEKGEFTSVTKHYNGEDEKGTRK